jgi:hypothetical protein
MNTFTIENIRNLKPCYDPGVYLPKDWRGTALDILKVKACPAIDRFWVIFHEGWIDEKILRLFTAWCERENLKLTDSPGPRSANVFKASSKATVWEAASAAARAMAWYAASAAAWDAAWAAAWDAAWAAAWDAAWAMAWDAQLAHLIKMLREIPE